MFLKVFHGKFAQTDQLDVSKERWVPNATGLKHLNTVLGQYIYKPRLVIEMLKFLQIINGCWNWHRHGLLPKELPHLVSYFSSS